MWKNLVRGFGIKIYFGILEDIVSIFFGNMWVFIYFYFLSCIYILYVFLCVWYFIIKKKIVNIIIYLFR